MEERYLVVIKTDGSHDNIYVEVNNLDLAEKIANVKDEKPVRVIDELGIIASYYRNGNFIKKL